MDRNYTLEHKTRSKHQGYVLLLLLTGFQQILLTRGQNLQSDAEELQPHISGPDYVTVGVPSSVECVTGCTSCTYSMSLQGSAAKGQDNFLVFKLKDYVEDLTVTCSVKTNGEGQMTTVTKKLQVLVGPVNVYISGTDLLNSSVSHTFSCHAHCQPSCSYSWKLGTGPWVSGQGNVISVKREMDNSETLVCKASNTVSGMFAAAVQNISVMGNHVASTHPEVTSAVQFLAAVLSVLSML